MAEIADSRRYDFSRADARTAGEDFEITFTVREKQSDGSYLNAASFAAYSGWVCYLFDDYRDAGGTAAERSTAAIASGAVTPGTPPSITVAYTALQTANVRPGDRWYELWATVSSKLTRLAYGILPFNA